MSYELIKVEKQGHVTIVTINRPEVMNAISPPHQCGNGSGLQRI